MYEKEKGSSGDGGFVCERRGERSRNGIVRESGVRVVLVTRFCVRGFVRENICLMLFYVLATSQVISGQVPTRDSAHS